MYLQVILLDDIGENLKPAQEMGMATVLVRDTETVLKELEELSGVQARRGGLGPLCPLALLGMLDQFCRARRDGLGLLALAVMAMLIQDLWVALETNGMGAMNSSKSCPGIKSLICPGVNRYPLVTSSPGPAEPCLSQTHGCPTSSRVVGMSRGAPGLLGSSPCVPHPAFLTPQLLTQEEPLPTACDPSNVTHGYVPIRVG